MNQQAFNVASGVAWGRRIMVTTTRRQSSHRISTARPPPGNPQGEILQAGYCSPDCNASGVFKGSAGHVAVRVPVCLACVYLRKLHNCGC